MTPQKTTKVLTIHFRKAGFQVQRIFDDTIKILPQHVVIKCQEPGRFHFYTCFDLTKSFNVNSTPTGLMLKLIRFKMIPPNAATQVKYYYRDKFKYPLKGIHPFTIFSIDTDCVVLNGKGITKTYSHKSFIKYFTKKPKYKV